MTEPVPEEEQGGDPPCWAAQFADDEEVGEDQVPKKGPERPTPGGGQVLAYRLP